MLELKEQWNRAAVERRGTNEKSNVCAHPIHEDRTSEIRLSCPGAAAHLK